MKENVCVCVWWQPNWLHQWKSYIFFYYSMYCVVLYCILLRRYFFHLKIKFICWVQWNHYVCAKLRHFFMFFLLVYFFTQNVKSWTNFEKTCIFRSLYLWNKKKGKKFEQIFSFLFGISYYLYIPKHDTYTHTYINYCQYTKRASSKIFLNHDKVQ